MFLVLNDSLSTGVLTVNGVSLAPGQSQWFYWNNATTSWSICVDGTRNNVTTVAGSGTITPSAIDTSTITVPVSGSVILNGPTGGIDGQKITLRIVNDATDTVSLATGSGNFEFGTDITSYTNSVSKIDYIGIIYNSAANVWHIASISHGFEL
jgi:hypothetical protein